MVLSSKTLMPDIFQYIFDCSFFTNLDLIRSQKIASEFSTNLLQQLKKLGFFFKKTVCENFMSVGYCFERNHSQSWVLSWCKPSQLNNYSLKFGYFCTLWLQKDNAAVYFYAFNAFTLKIKMFFRFFFDICNIKK